MALLPESARIDYAIATGSTKDLPLLSEWAFDFETMQFKVDANGLPYLVERNEALKIWLFWAVTTAKKRWSANSRGYGSEVERMIGLPVTVAIKSDELKRTIREAVEFCPYVKRVERIDVALEDEMVTVTVNVVSMYDDEVVSVNVKV